MAMSSLVRVTFGIKNEKCFETDCEPFLQFSVPSWPLQARAVVMTLSIENRMEEVGKFLFKYEIYKQKFRANSLVTLNPIFFQYNSTYQHSDVM